MNPEELIKKQREQIEELSKLLGAGTLEPEKLNDMMAGMKGLFAPQLEKMSKVVEQLKDAEKKLAPMTDFLNSEVGKEAMKKYFSK